VVHGFYGPLSGTDYTTVDYMTGGTMLRGINDSGYMTGIFNYSQGTNCGDGEFEIYPDGKIGTITDNGTPLNGIVQGINNKKNVFAGNYCDSGTGTQNAYEGKSLKYVQDVNVSISTQGLANGRGINNAGDVVGFFRDKNGNVQGFFVSGGTATEIAFPSKKEVATYVYGINDKDIIAGQWVDKSGIISGFLLNAETGKFTTIKVPGSTAYVSPLGISDSGLVAVDSDVGDYIYCSTNKNCPANGIHVIDENISVPLGSFPRYACRDACRSLAFPITGDLR